MANKRWRRSLWMLWLASALGLASWLALPLVRQDQQQHYLIGATTSGHHQIELECKVCHTQPFGGAEVLQNACVDCHGDELKAANDSHPRKKFTDPRNADMIAVLDARYCASCHREHQPEQTLAMGLTLPGDFCYRCHSDIGSERDTHAGLGFDTCASAGCHNFHDNLALYESFLLQHAGEPPIADVPRVAVRDGLTRWRERRQARESTLPVSSTGSEVPEHWHGSQHAEAGLACRDCHAADDADAAAWIERPDQDVCSDCHRSQVDTFLDGKHGMRLAAGLSAMTVADGDIPLQTDAAHRSLGCGSCHQSHAYDTRYAAVEACLGCHASDHALAYQDSPHGQLSRRSGRTELPPEAAVTCATCHMPRAMGSNRWGDEQVVVNHNQNANLRPNEKMIRSVCMNCHGLSFSIDALADPRLIANNFDGHPTEHIESIDMALKRDAAAADRDNAYR